MAFNPDTIPVSLPSELTNIQLLELPPSVLAQIESGNDTKLEVKSLNQPGSFAAICTDQDSYKLVVHQTSNSVYVVQPDGHGIRAIARAGAVLEMVTIGAAEVDEKAAGMLEATLLSWDIDQQPRKPSNTTETRTTKAGVFAGMPYSTGQLERTWFRLCCFEDDHGCQIPDSQSLLTAWKSLITASTADSLPITVGNRAELRTLLREEHIPMALFDVLLLHATNASTDEGAALISWTGTMLLEVKHEMDRMGFLDEWRDLLPDTIATETNVNLMVLKDVADLSDPTMVKTKRLAKPAAATASKGLSREWHERFGKSKGR